MDRDCAGDEIGFGGQDIPIFSNARYFSGMFQFAERLSERNAFVASQLELARDLDLVERPVIALSEQRENIQFDVTSALSHVSETILLKVIVDITGFQPEVE